MTLDFTYKDVFRSVRLGFSPKKIWVAFRGIFYAVILYAIFSYLAFLVSGWGIKNIWQTYRYIPFPFLNAHLTWYGWILWIVGALFALFYYMVTFTAISKITFEQLKGDEFFETKEAWKFAYKNWKGTFLSPIYLSIFIAILIFVGMLIGLVGRIPTFGQIIVGIIALPTFAGAFFVVYLTIVLGVILLIAPAIVSTTESDTFDTLFEGFSVLNDQTWRFFLWEFILMLCAFLAMLVFAILIKYTLRLSFWAVGIWQGPRNWWNIMWQNGKWYLYLPFAPTWLLKWFPSIVAPAKFISAGMPKVYPGAATSFGGFLVGLSFYGIAFAILAYGAAIVSAGQTIIYTILVKLKDDKNLLEKKEELFEAEEVTVKPEKIEKTEKTKTKRRVTKIAPKKKAKKTTTKKKPKKTTTKKKTTAKKSTAKKKTKKTTKK